MKQLLNQLQEINNTYIVNVKSGFFLETGSFIAIDNEGKEYFANLEFVKNYSDLFKALKEESTTCWILVNDEVWGPKYGNREVSKINTISLSKVYCKQFKINKLHKYLLNLKIHEIFDLQLDAIRNKYILGNAENVVLYEKIFDILNQNLTELNSLMPHDF